MHHDQASRYLALKERFDASLKADDYMAIMRTAGEAMSLLGELMAGRPSELLEAEQAKRHQLSLDEASLRLTGKTMLKEAEIVKAARPYLKGSGVYFLVSGAEVVYAGQSTNVLHRISQHVGRLQFNAYAYAPFEPHHLDVAESLYIHMLQPRHNGKSSDNFAPISLPRLFDMLLEKAG